jgi:ComF family protein
VAGGEGAGAVDSGPAVPLWRRVAAEVVELILPVTCVCCGSFLRSAPGIVCGPCWTRLPALPAPRCDRCGHPTWGRPCRWCSVLPAYVRAARSVCWERPETSAQSLVHALKYGGWPRVGDAMADRMARLDWPEDVRAERAALIPVPLAASRLRERGYNQSEVLADALARRWQVPVWRDVVHRQRATRTQTRLTPADRLRNVSGAFRADSSTRKRLRGAHVVLVDDVVTTASTLNACAAALCEGGARIISYVTFARAPALGDRC